MTEEEVCKGDRFTISQGTRDCLELYVKNWNGDGGRLQSMEVPVTRGEESKILSYLLRRELVRFWDRTYRFIYVVLGILIGLVTSLVVNL